MQRGKRFGVRGWWRSGAPWVWLTAGAVSVSVLVVVGLILMLAVRGLGHFWPGDVLKISYRGDGGTETLIGELTDESTMPLAQYRELTGMNDAPPKDHQINRWLIKTGNRDTAAPDFRWLYAHRVLSVTQPHDLVAFERLEWGTAYGDLLGVHDGAGAAVTGPAAWRALQLAIARAGALRNDLHDIENNKVGAINRVMEALRLQRRGLALRRGDIGARAYSVRLADLDAREAEQRGEYAAWNDRIAALRAALDKDSIALRIMDGRTISLPVQKLVRAWQPNAMTTFAKARMYLTNVVAFLSEPPREANTEGGVFPAIFGTVVMVLLMSLIVTPFGVVAAIYLREYARNGIVVRIVRIAVNNLAGVPSIVYGVFGLGFFVYFLGGNIDQLFFPEALPAPTFGTPGLMWAAVTLALLTVPVVIVSTEEGLSRIPRAIREGSLALGATKAETLFRVVLPLASPSILTGVILAIARAAGEVAPLMLVGVVKLAPQLPVDLTAPFIHLDRKFMHLGFHIYDVGFQSPNVDASRPIVYATAFLLVLIVIVLNLTAILLRGRLERRYRFAE